MGNTKSINESLGIAYVSDSGVICSICDSIISRNVSIEDYRIYNHVERCKMPTGHIRLVKYAYDCDRCKLIESHRYQDIIKHMNKECNILSEENNIQENNIDVNTEILNENNECSICMDSTRDIVFIPCGHIASCYECGFKLKHCCICREEIIQVYKIYF